MVLGFPWYPNAGPRHEKQLVRSLARDSVLAAYGATIIKKHPNSLWRREVSYPARGLRLEIRPMTPDDDEREANFFDAQTVKERIMRFMGVIGSLTPQRIRTLTHLDFNRDFAIVAVDRATDLLVAVARFCRSPDADTSEQALLGVAVLQEYQRLGLARYLLAAVFDAARDQGIRSLVAEILKENVASRRLFERIAGDVDALKRVDASDRDVDIFYFELGSVRARAEEPGVLRPPPTGGERPPAFVVSEARHPRSLWRHDLSFPATGLRVEVRPVDADDQERLTRFERSFAIAGADLPKWCHDRNVMDFTTGFALVAIDMASDELVALAHFHRSADGSRLDVACAPKFCGLGIADFLTSELLRAAGSEVMAPARASL